MQVTSFRVSVVVALGCAFSGCIDFKSGAVLSQSTSSLLTDIGPAAINTTPFTVANADTLSVAPSMTAASDFGRVPQSLGNSFAYFPANSAIDVGSAKSIGQSLAVHTRYGLFISNDRGATWSVRNSKNGLASDSVTDSIELGGWLFVALNEGIAVSKDLGLTFSMVPGLFTPTATNVPMVSQFVFYNQVLFVAHSQGLLVSKDGGRTFAPLASAGLTGTISGLIATSAGLVAATSAATGNGALSSIFVSKDNGVHWTKALVPTAYSSVSPTSLVALGTKIVATTYAGIYVSNDAGVSFTETVDSADLGMATYGIGKVVSFGGKLFVSGATRALSVSADGVNFSLVSPPVAGASATESYIALGGSSTTGELYVTGNANGGFYATADGGATLALRAGSGDSASLTKNYNLQSVYANGTAVLTVSGTDAIYYSGDDGKTFLPTAIRVFMNGVATGFQVRTAVLNGSQLVAATSGGLFTTENFNLATDNAVRVWTHRSVNSGSADVYCGNAAGTVMMACTANGFVISTDSGATFTSRTTANGLANNFVRRFVIDGFDWFLATNSGIAHSSNGGANFTDTSLASPLGGFANVNDVQRLANGQIYAITPGGFAMSADNGATWKVPVLKREGAVVPMSTAGGGGAMIGGAAMLNGKIYVGTANGIAISNDSGATFTIESLGMGLGTGTYTGVTDITATPGGELFFTTQRGLYKLLREPTVQ